MLTGEHYGFGNEEPVTRNAICVRLQVSVYQINRDQKVRALIAEVMARRPDAEALRQTKREDELIDCLRSVYASLAANQEPLSCNRLYLATGKSDMAFRRYPRVRAAAEKLVAAHEQNVLRLKSTFVTLLATRTMEMQAKEMIAIPDLPTQLSATVAQPLCVHLEQKQRRQDRDSTLKAEVAQAIKELESRGQEVTSSAVCALTGWSIQTLCSSKYPQTRQLMREIMARRVELIYQWRAEREMELLYQVRQAYTDFQQFGQPVQVQMIAKAIGLSLATMRRYPAVKAELARIRANTVSQNQWERQCRETDLLSRLEAYVYLCEKQRQPLIIKTFEQVLAMPLSSILGYPRLRERIEQIRSVKREQRQSRVGRTDLF
jgi:hypothetical protein